MEGIEAGTSLFLIDEDTSATNFMVRDEFMQEVIRREKEPITPFLERAGDLYEKAGISTILVAGSSGAFFYIAHKILQMDCYRPVDITERVKSCAGNTRLRVPRHRVFSFRNFRCLWFFTMQKRITGTEEFPGEEMKEAEDTAGEDGKRLCAGEKKD